MSEGNVSASSVDLMNLSNIFDSLSTKIIGDFDQVLIGYGKNDQEERQFEAAGSQISIVFASANENSSFDEEPVIEVNNFGINQSNAWKLEAVFSQEHLQNSLLQNANRINNNLFQILLRKDSRKLYLAEQEDQKYLLGSEKLNPNSDLKIRKKLQLEMALTEYGIDSIEEVTEKGISRIL